MISKLKKTIPDTHPFRLFYHKVMAIIAAVINGFPANRLTVIGVTGTNGKTTTVNLLTNILNETGEKVGLASTINFQVGSERWTNDLKQSTLSPFQLQKLLKRMVKAGCKYAVIEVTSHAIVQSRVWGVNIDVALFTNVTPEHIEYHGSFENYLRAKTRLFQMVSQAKRKPNVPKVLISNADDKNFKQFDQYPADRKLTYGLKAATVYAEKIEKHASGSNFVMHVPNNVIDLEVKLPGEFNVYNALAASTIAIALGVPLEKIRDGLKNTDLIPGRFESVEKGQDFNIIVDYAHTPESLENLFALYQQLTDGRLIVVFGSTGGGRDKAKRPRLGEIANEYANVVILTNDDPYTEDQWGIIDQVAEGVPRKEGDDFWKIVDRREALRLALSLAEDGDTVVAAGKGAEEVMIVGEERVPWNDRKVIEELLEREVEINLE